nr:MARVEL domain-containing protein 3 [Vicugna pacos]
MERPSGTREPRAQPRERDPDRHPRSDRDRHPERERDRAGDRRRERNGGGRRDGDRDRERDREPRQDRHRAGDHRTGEQRVRGAESEPTSGRYPLSNPRPELEEVEYYQSEAEGLLECHKCRYLCTGRGVIQIVEVILNGMILMCIVASYFVLAGFSASFASGGGFGNNYYSPFEGTELEQVRQLDQQYTVLRAPLIYGGVAVSLGLGVLTLGVLLQGAKSLNKLPRKWLLLEAAFSLLAAVGYCVGIGVYLHAALQINSTDTCRTRERVYARKGLTWMNCQLSGTDGAAATFACLLVIMYGASVVLALRSYREQKHYQDSQEQHRNYSDAPEYLWSGTL